LNPKVGKDNHEMVEGVHDGEIHSLYLYGEDTGNHFMIIFTNFRIQFNAIFFFEFSANIVRFNTLITRAKFEKEYGVKLNPKVGKDNHEMVEGVHDGEIHSLYPFSNLARISSASIL
jgi:predicted molibdopterin-dependent oxidoreductase YjgC